MSLLTKLRPSPRPVPVRHPRPPTFNSDVALLFAAAQQCYRNAADFATRGETAKARRAEADSRLVYAHYQAALFESHHGRTAPPNRAAVVKFARAVMAENPPTND